jgi:hypothetical protein
MNQHILELMKQADYPAPEIALRAQSLVNLVVNDNIRLLRSNGYDDAAQCLHDVHFGMDNPV